MISPVRKPVRVLSFPNARGRCQILRYDPLAQQNRSCDHTAVSEVAGVRLCRHHQALVHAIVRDAAARVERQSASGAPLA